MALGFAILPVAVLTWVATPGFMEPMFAGHSWDFVPALGIIGVVIGEVLMYRIYGSDPEAGDRIWRYRDF